MDLEEFLLKFLNVWILITCGVYMAYVFFDDFSRLYLTIPVLLCIIITILGLAILMYRRFNMRLAKDISRQVTVIMIFWLMVINLLDDILFPEHSFSWVFGVLFLASVMTNIFLDAVHPIPRNFRLTMCAAGVALLLSLLMSLYYHTTPCVNDGVFRASDGNITKPLLQRTLFTQLLVLHMQAVLVLVRDKEQKFLPFSLAPVSKRHETHSIVHLPTSSDLMAETTPPNRIVYMTRLRCYKHEIAVLFFGTCSLALFLAFVFVSKNFVLAGCLFFSSVTMLVLAVRFVYWRNLDWTVVKLSLQQFTTLTILGCIAINLILDIVLPPDELAVPNAIFLAIIVCCNALLDAVITASRLLKIMWFAGMCINMATVLGFHYTQNPCETDTLTSIFGAQINRTLAKRGIFATLFLMHFRAMILLLTDHGDEYFVLVTGRTRKHPEATFVTTQL